MRNYKYKYLWLLVLLLTGLVGPFAHALKFRYIEFEILKLPVWRFYEAEEDVVGYYPGGGLWPEGCLPDKGAEYVVSANEEFRKTRLGRKYPSEELEEGAEEVEIHHPKVRFLVDEPSNLPDLPSHPSAKAAPELAADSIAQILAAKPANMLMDPQNFLHGQRVNDILRFLELQSEQSKFDIYTVVLGRNQSVSAIDLFEVHEKWFGENYAALLLYHVNAPERTKLILGDNVPEGAAEKLVKQIVSKTSNAKLPEDQLENLAIELSIQLFGLAVEMDRPEPVEVVEPVIEVIQLDILPQPQSPPEPVAVVALKRPVGPVEGKPENSLIGTKVADGSLVTSIMRISCSIIAIAIFVWLAGWVLRRRTDAEPITFPTCPPQPRLSGEFSGGTFYGMDLNPSD